MATELKGIAVAFSQLKPDLVIILGDRYDIFPAAIATHILQIPLAHIHGGEVTSGVIDDGIGIQSANLQIYILWQRMSLRID